MPSCQMEGSFESTGSGLDLRGRGALQVLSSGVSDGFGLGAERQMKSEKVILNLQQPFLGSQGRSPQLE